MEASEYILLRSTNINQKVENKTLIQPKVPCAELDKYMFDI